MNNQDRIDMRLDTVDKAKIKDLAKSANMSITKYLVTLGVGQEIKVGLISKLNEFLEELKRQGNNLNQIAKGINQASKIGDFEVNQQLQRDINSISENLKQLKIGIEQAIKA